MEAIQMNAIISALISRLDIEQIYQQYYDTPKSAYEVVILISNKCTKTLTELEPLAARVLMDYPSCRFRLYYAHQVKEAMRKGNLFFYGFCSLDNLVYIKPDSDYEFDPEQTPPTEVIKNAKHYFEREMEKTYAFKEGAGFYFEKGHYGQAAFMLHQVIELTYRAIELFIMGKDKRTHNIRAHQKYVRTYIPLLADLFSEDEGELTLLKRLDDAYLAVRYENTYEISKADIELIFSKAERIQQMVSQIYTDILSSFESRIAYMQPPSVPSVDTLKKATIESTIQDVVSALSVLLHAAAQTTITPPPSVESMRA